MIFFKQNNRNLTHFLLLRQKHENSLIILIRNV